MANILEGMSKDKLTDKQRAFVDEYLVDFNATKAAIRSGYSEKTAYSIGWENLRKPEIKKYIKDLIEERVVSADETKKLLSDIARGSLNDYIVVRQVQRSKVVERNLSDLITELKNEISFEEEFAQRAGFTEERLGSHQRSQLAREEQLLRMQMELERNPGAKKLVQGESELVDEADLDLVKLAKDKESGKIKSLSYGQFGPKVEMYAADAALANLAKIHGIFAPVKQDVTVNKGFFDFLKETSKNDG